MEVSWNVSLFNGRGRDHEPCIGSELELRWVVESSSGELEAKNRREQCAGMVAIVVA